MCARNTPNLTNYFSGAKQSQQLSEAEQEIQQLRAEIEELRDKNSGELETQLEELRTQLQLQIGILSIPIEQIEPNIEQPRQTFLPESLESMSRSLTSDGQLQPVILIQRENHLLIFDGERRWRSAKALGWQTLSAVIIPEPTGLHRKALLTSLHREDLNPLDKAEAIARELSTITGLELQDIPRILSTVVRRLNSQKRITSLVDLITADAKKQEKELESLDLSDSERAILSLLLDLQLNPASIDANIFPMLSLAEDLKLAIRAGLKGVHAMALQKLSAKNLGLNEQKAQLIREKTTQKVVSEKLSVIATRKLVAEVITSHSQSEVTNTTREKAVLQVSRRLEQLSLETLKQANSTELIDLQEVLRKKLVEIEQVLKQN
ncbi:parB, chromosome partitioning protein, ParB family (plasmid) [Nostoc flagelliforme CCNUN1]|uniref:ParB, chromosome partitioning protein, ParB family n=1 Tax=Nostoc flagelliforme CCNUN1 TaxID=2038116 RepID=A0A2K8T8I9_9NOSO|nr:ParB/RepB/Spo0J family partition protein [Nostoc flagelliforme]AUB43971.1 parB, chromosome partitioning protein, ParB family [Nostoc flagelliforme CCNUN1]